MFRAFISVLSTNKDSPGILVCPVRITNIMIDLFPNMCRAAAVGANGMFKKEENISKLPKNVARIRAEKANVEISICHFFPILNNTTQIAGAPRSRCL